MIILKRLKWSNMFSYGSDNELILDDQPVTQILGLNGHGKSSIPLIIEELLFNKNSKGVKKSAIVNRELKINKYGGSITFLVKDDEYELTISRNGNVQKVKLTKNGTDISSHTATDTFKQVEDIMEIDFKTFSQLVYQNSTSSLQFLTATDTNRKKFLIELLSLEKYVRIFEEVKELHKNISDKVIASTTRLELVRSSLSKLSSQSTAELQIEPLPVLKETVREELKELETTIDSITNTNSKINTNNQYIKLRDALDLTTLTESYTKLDDSNAQQAVGAVRSVITDKTTLVTKLKKLTEATCPTCCQSIDHTAINNIINVAEEEIASQTALREKLLLEIKDIKANNTKYDKHLELVADFERYSSLIDSNLPRILLERVKLQEDLQVLKDYIKNIEDEIDSTTLANNKAIAHNAKIDLIKQQLEDLKSSIITIQEELSTVEQQANILEILKKAFSTNGLIAYKIENSVKDLQHLTNHYLTELSDGRFQLMFAINNDKLNVIIIDNGQEVEITALSAGELARVTTSTLLAIRKLMASLSKSRMNILFLDETIDVLDTYGKEKLIEVLLKEDLNTFLISHSYSHPLIKKLQVVKEQGISRVQDDC